MKYGLEPHCTHFSRVLLTPSPDYPLKTKKQTKQTNKRNPHPTGQEYFGRYQVVTAQSVLHQVATNPEAG